MIDVSRFRTTQIVHHRFGDPTTVLEVEKDVAIRALTKGEVFVRVTRSMIHPGDLQLVAAKYTPGSETIPQGRVPGLAQASTLE